MKKRLAGIFFKFQLESTIGKIRREATAGHQDAAWKIAQPLIAAQAHQPELADALLGLLAEGMFSVQQTVEVLESLLAAHAQDFKLLARIGGATECARDIDFLNLARPEEPVFDAILVSLQTALKQTHDADSEYWLWAGLNTCARVMARQQDAVAEFAAQRMVALKPDSASAHYQYGLLLKTRGRFAESLAENQRAIALAKEPTDAMYWNAGICATGAGAADLALDIWKRLGNTIEMGRFGLPDGGYPQCKVRLAQRPLAERNKNCDDPGLEETIWIERLSPCHGIIRSVLYQDLGVDYGDVILIDGAPITYHTYGDNQVPVFPHLATLLHRNYQFYDFAGTQDEAGKLANTTEDLGRDAIVYAHSEKFRVLCATCWRDEVRDHSHGSEQETHHVVKGRIAAPPEFSPMDLLRELDAALTACEPCRIYSPALCEAAGLSDRAEFERRRYNLLQEN